MKKSSLGALLLSVGVAGLALHALAQTAPVAPLEDLVGVRQADQTTVGVDAQHSRWIKLDQFIRPERMNLFKPRWSLQLTNRQVAGQAYAAGPTATMGIGETVGFLGGSGNNIVGYDTDTGKLYWQRSFDSPAPANPTANCPGSTAVSVTRAAALTPPAVTPVPPRAVAPPFGSAVGAPGEGLPQAFVDASRTNPRPVQVVDPNAAAAAPAAGRGGRGLTGAAPNANYVYAVSNDGKLHYLGPESGKDIVQPATFLPAGAQPTDLIAINANGLGTVYAATTHGCGGAPDGLYAFNLTSGQVTRYLTGGGAPSGPPSFSADGTAYLAIGAGAAGTHDAIVALDPASLTVKATFSQAGADFTAAPTVFTSAGKTIVADIAADGRIFLLDAANLSGAPLATTPGLGASAFRPGGLASWEDDAGQRWLLAPTADSVVAYKVAPGGASLTRAYVVPGLVAPLPPLVASGVVFIASSGRYLPPRGASITPDQLATRSRPGKVLAVDGETGKLLWDTGSTLKSWIPERGFWSTVGNVEVATYDNKVQQFGMNMDRYAP